MQVNETGRVATGSPQKRAKKRFLERRFFKLINWYPPFWGAGIRVVSTSPDYRTIQVQLKLTWYNRNAVGTHFGGSLYAMCDPFFMLMMMHQLGEDYIVWDKSATIQFIRPGRGTVTATFNLPEDRVTEIRARADQGEKVEPVFQVDVLDEQGERVARVDKLLYIRKKNAPRKSGEA